MPVRAPGCGLNHELHMKPHFVGRLVAMVLFGVLLAAGMHREHVQRGRLGREAFLAQQAERFDRHFAKPDPVAVELAVGLPLTAGFLVAYELVAYGVTKVARVLAASKNHRQ